MIASMLQRGSMMLELVRFSHTIFALPFALLATIMAFTVPLDSGRFPAFRLQDLIGILCCMVFARTSAMAFNRVVDRQFDAANPRTANRHLPAGLMPVWQAVALTIISGLAFVAATLLFLPNILPVSFAVPVLLFLCGYSYAKRFTAGAHLWLGIALSLSPICAWVAIRGVAPWADPIDVLPAVVLAAAVATWVAGFDMIYACQDADFDRQSGLHSIPAKIGIRGALRLAAGLHAITVGLLLALPWTSAELGLGWLYWGAIVGIGVLLWYEHSLVSPDNLERVGIAFFNVNAIISVVVLLAAGIDCWF